MTREEFLRQKITDKYESIRAFAQFIDMPYSTLASIMKNIGGASITNLQKICGGLGLSLDDLAYYESGKKVKSYYLDPEAAEYAEYARTNPNIRIMFSAAKDITKEQMEETVNYINYLKSKEGHNNDNGEY